MAEGNAVPVAGAPFTTRTYIDPTTGKSFIAVIFPSAAVALAFLLDGDAYPRVQLNVGGAESGIFTGDGTAAPAAGESTTLAGDVTGPSDANTVTSITSIAKVTDATPYGDQGLMAPGSTDPGDGGWLDIEWDGNQNQWTWGFKQLTAGGVQLIITNGQVEFYIYAADGGSPFQFITPENNYQFAMYADDAQTIPILVVESKAGAQLLAFLPGGALELTEQADPAAPFANRARFYSRDDGGGNTQLAAIFPNGVPVPIVTDPQTSGALPTQTFTTGTAAQVSTTKRAEVHTPVTFNPGVATIATLKVELSPDNVTYSTLAIWTVPVGVAFAGTIQDVVCSVPAGWRLKLTATNATIAASTLIYT